MISTGYRAAWEAREAREAVSGPVYARAREAALAGLGVVSAVYLLGGKYLPYLPLLPTQKKRTGKNKGLNMGECVGGKRFRGPIASLASRIGSAC